MTVISMNPNAKGPMVIREFKTRKAAEKFRDRVDKTHTPYVEKEAKSSFGDKREGPFYKVYVEV